MKKKLIIALIVIALLVGLTALVMLLPEKEPEPTATPTPDVSLEPDETAYLINEQFTKFTGLTVWNAEGEQINELRAGIDEDGEMFYEIVGAREGWDYSDDLMRSTAASLSTLAAMSVVADSMDDPAQYGLDEPQWTFEAVYGDDRTYRIEVGAPTALANSYYCSNGDGRVYAVGAYSVSVITRSEMSYRAYSFFPDYYDTETLEYATNGAIVYVRAYDPASGYDMIIRKVEEGEFPVGKAMTDLYMESPIEAFCVDAQVEDYFINGAVAIKVNGIYLDDPTEEQLAECGFSENSPQVWIRNDDGQEVHYTIGTMLNGNAYVMVEGVNTILTAESVYDAIFKIDYTTLIFKMLVTSNISDVATVEFDMMGDKNTLELDYEEPAEEGQSGTVFGSLNGEAISSKNASRIYARLLAVQVYEGYDEETASVSATSEYSIKITENDGTSTTLELRRINDRRYAAFIDGEATGYAVHVDPIKELAGAFDIVERGEELSRVN